MFTFNPPSVTEIAPDVFRIGLYVPEIDLQFNFFLVRDEQPLLFTTGYRATFPSLREAVARVIEPARIRPRTDGILQRLADLKPRTLAIMHGSSFAGDGERALRDLAVVLRETLGDPSCRQSEQA